METDDSKIFRLTHNRTDDYGPDWSPNGQRVAFVSNQNGRAQIYVIEVGGSDLQCLTDDDGNHYNPVWSPDGREIAFYADHNRRLGIYVINADDSRVRRPPEGLFIGFPAWSPDGNRIAFASSSSTYSKFFTSDTSKRNSQLLTDNMGRDSAPTWRP